MSRRTTLAAISPVASAQWGIITAGQARRLGVSCQDVNRLVDDGTLAVAAYGHSDPEEFLLVLVGETDQE
jgi:hypothetical protein